jgi:phosphatidylglycerophosphate synthase
MKLHRIEGKSEWDNLDKSRRNKWQRIAAHTKGIIAPGNVLTISGFALVIIGLSAILRESYWLGLFCLIVGRLLDIADGMIADQTGTKSPLGEALDAGLDKFITVLTLAVLLVTGIAQWFVVVVLLFPHVTIALISLFYVAKGTRLHPSRLGKFSMALAWAGLVGLVLVRCLDEVNIFLFVSYGLISASVLLGIGTIIEYHRD